MAYNFDFADAYKNLMAKIQGVDEQSSAYEKDIVNMASEYDSSNCSDSDAVTPSDECDDDCDIEEICEALESDCECELESSDGEELSSDCESEEEEDSDEDAQEEGGSDEEEAGSDDLYREVIAAEKSHESEDMEAPDVLDSKEAQDVITSLVNSQTLVREAPPMPGFIFNSQIGMTRIPVPFNKPQPLPKPILPPKPAPKPKTPPPKPTTPTPGKVQVDNSKVPTPGQVTSVKRRPSSQSSTKAPAKQRIRYNKILIDGKLAHDNTNSSLIIVWRACTLAAGVMLFIIHNGTESTGKIALFWLVVTIKS